MGRLNSDSYIANEEDPTVWLQVDSNEDLKRSSLERLAKGASSVDMVEGTERTRMIGLFEDCEPLVETDGCVLVKMEDTRLGNLMILICGK